MKRLHIVSLIMITLLAGCAVRSFFDEEIGEFTLVDDIQSEKPAVQEKTTVAYHESVVPRDSEDEDFSWVDEEDLNDDFGDIVYFPFDKSELTSDQETVAQNNVKKIVEAYNEACREGQEPIVVIEGHSCSITRSRVYNLALSEKRAKVISDKLVEAGVPRLAIKVVGRGEEYPAIVDGKPVTGSKEEQWPNRRSETHIIYA